MAVIARKQLTGSTQKIKEYAGHEGQLVFDKQTKHLHVLSGTAGKTTELANKSDIPTVDGGSSDYIGTIKSLNFDVNTGAVTVVKSDDTIVPRKLATDLYVADKLKTKEDKGTAYSKEESDGKYSTKTETTQGLAGKANTSHTHTTSQITDFPSIPDVSTLIPKRGYREGLAGYEHIVDEPSGIITINSPDVCGISGSNVTISQDEDPLEASWTKVVFVNADTQVTLPKSWVWLGGSAPTIDKVGILILHASSVVGVANYIKGSI